MFVQMHWGLAAGASVHVHIDADSLIGNDPEPLRLRTDVLANAILYIQDVAAEPKGQTVVSVCVCSDVSDLSFSILTQND